MIDIVTCQVHPVLVKTGQKSVRSVSCRCPEPRVICWRPHLAGTRQYNHGSCHALASWVAQLYYTDGSLSYGFTERSKT